MATASRSLTLAYRGRYRPSREYRDNLPVFMPLEPAVSLELFVRQQERLEQIMGPELASYFQYEARGDESLPAAILSSAPRSEAKAILRIMERLEMTVAQVIAWISISAAQRSYIQQTVGVRAAAEAADYREKVLDEFLTFYRKREAVRGG